NDLAAWFWPPAALFQVLFMAEPPGDHPVGFCTYALFSEEAEREFAARRPITPCAWNSGNRLWIIDAVCNQDTPTFVRLLQQHMAAAYPHMHEGKGKWFRRYRDPQRRKLGSVVCVPV